MTRGATEMLAFLKWQMDYAEKEKNNMVEAGLIDNFWIGYHQGLESGSRLAIAWLEKMIEEGRI